MMIRPIFTAIIFPQLVSALLVCAFTTSLMGQEKIDLEVRHEKGQQYRVQTQIEHAGTVIVDYSNKKTDVKHLAIDVKARLDYHERFVGADTKPQAVRYYDQSLAHIKLDKASTDSKLNTENHLIVARISTEDGNTYQIASVEDILEQRELELLRHPADPLSFAGLLNKQGVQVGSEWEPTKDNLARFLSVDHVIQSDVKLRLKDADADLAKVYIMGKVKAEVDDAMTEMTITGVMQIDRKSKIVAAMRLNVIEAREPAQIAPGFDGKTKVDLQIAKANEIPQLTNSALKKIAESRSIRNLLKWESYTGNFSLKYDPSWKIIASEEEAAVLRYVENGDLLAQCNIVRLASRPADKPLSLRDFESEVSKIISKDPTSRVLGADQSTTSTGLKALRVTVRGIEEEVPVNWIYYNVASPDGRQVTFVFTLEEEIAGRVEPAARKIVNGFVFNKVNNELKLDLLKQKPGSRDAKANGSSTTR